MSLNSDGLGILEECQRILVLKCKEHKLDLNTELAVYPLLPDDAIGKNASDDFVIKKGKETVIEANFLETAGQAFTDTPSKFSGFLGQILELPLIDSKDRAVFTASMNAVLRYLDLVCGTLHCKDEAPSLCGPEIAKRIKGEWGNPKIGLVGLQPAILKALVDFFGSDNIQVVDLNPERIGTTVSGVEILDGDNDLLKLVNWCDIGLVTGSTIVNGTIDNIFEAFKTAGKKIIFFGNTISGGATLLGLDHI